MSKLLIFLGPTLNWHKVFFSTESGTKERVVSDLVASHLCVYMISICKKNRKKYDLLKEKAIGFKAISWTKKYILSLSLHRYAICYPNLGTHENPGGYSLYKRLL